MKIFKWILLSIISLFAVNGILYNHESPRRSPMFVVPKIIKHVIENYKEQTKKPR